MDSQPVSTNGYFHPTAPSNNAPSTPVHPHAGNAHQRCPRRQCNHASLPLGWEYKLCRDCLHEMRKVNHERVEERRRRERVAKTGTIDPGAQHRSRNPAIPPPVDIVPCYFCTARVIVPPGHGSGGPLLCESCFRRAVAARQRQPTIQLPTVPQVMQPPPHATPNPFTLQSATWNVPSVPTAATKATVAYVRAPDAHTEERSSPAGHPGTPVISSQEASVPPEASKPSLLSVSVDDDKDLDFDSLELVYPEDDSNDAPLPESDLVAQSGTISHGEASSSRDENPSIEEAPSVMELPDGWDSDLSDLTVLTDSGESEIDSEVEEELFPARTGLKIRIKIPPGFSFDTLGPSPSRVCHLKRCGRVLETGSRWKLCESCRAKFRQYQRARLNIQRPYKDKATAGNIVPGPNVDQNRSSLGERSKDSQSDVPRECSRRACRRLLPPVEQYRWKLCEKCHLRGHFGYKRRRAVGLLHPEVGQEAGVVRGGLAQHIIQMFNKQKAKREEHERGGTTSNPDTTPVDVQSPSVDKPSEPSTATNEVADQSPSPRSLPAMMLYQSRDDILRGLRAYVSDFLGGFIQYARVRIKAGLPTDLPEPLAFAFDGAYSTVTDAALDSEHTGQEMLAMKIGIEGVLGLNFSPVCFPVIECGQIVARFSCAHQLAIPIATGPSPSGTATPPADSSQGSGQVTLKSTPATELSPACDPIILNRNMAGEFELRIMEDHDHPMFRGHRTVLRFRLVG